MIRSMVLSFALAMQERFHLLVGFEPTRTMLIRAEWNGRDLLGNAGRVAQRARAESSEFGRLAVTWPDGIAPGESVELELFYLGELPRVQFEEWDVAGEGAPATRLSVGSPAQRMPAPEPLSGAGERSVRKTPAAPERRHAEKGIAEKRPAALVEDPVQQRLFFTELNTRSLPAYMRIAGLDPALIERREAMFAGLHPFLTNRLWQTFHWESGTPLPDVLAVPSREWVVEFASVFWGALEAAFGAQPEPLDVSLVGQIGVALDRFAGGMLRHPVSAQEMRELGVPDAWHNDTDSFFVYFFAEFAFVAIEHGVEAARFRALLPRLVRMQKFFNARFTRLKNGAPAPTIDRVGVFTKYMQPPLHALESAGYQALSAFPLVSGMHALRAEVHENLHEIAESFGSRTPPRA